MFNFLVYLGFFLGRLSVGLKVIFRFDPFTVLSFLSKHRDNLFFSFQTLPTHYNFFFFRVGATNPLNVGGGSVVPFKSFFVFPLWGLCFVSPFFFLIKKRPCAASSFCSGSCSSSLSRYPYCQYIPWF